MAMRGEFLFTGYMAGRGTVRVFHDLDSTTHVFAMLSSGQSIYTTRDRIAPRKPAQSTPAPVKPPKDDWSGDTLFDMSIYDTVTR